MTAAVESLPSEPISHIIKDSPLGDLPKDDPLTKDQWRTLLAIADTVVPAIIESTKPSTPFKAIAVESKRYAGIVATIDKYARESEHVNKTENLTQEYLAERPSKIPGFRDALYRFLALNTPPDQVRMIGIILNLLKYVSTSSSYASANLCQLPRLISPPHWRCNSICRPTRRSPRANPPRLVQSLHSRLPHPLQATHRAHQAKLDQSLAHSLPTAQFTPRPRAR